MKSQAEPFDFDQWKELAATDPQGFEKRRREVIEREILRIPRPLRQQRLRGLQWQIDLIRKRYKDPHISTTKLFDMMWRRVYGEGGFLDTLANPPTSSSPGGRKRAQVIDLRSRAPQRQN